MSDGRWEIFPESKFSFEKVDEFEKKEHILVDTSKPIEESVKQVMEEMRTGNRTEAWVDRSPLKCTLPSRQGKQVWFFF